MRLRPFNGVFLSAGTWAIAVGAVGAAIALLLGVQSPWLYCGAIVGAGALAAVRAVYRVRLEVDADEIRVFNVRKTYRVRWESVARIDAVSLWLSPGVLMPVSRAVRIRTRDGQRIVIDASQYEVAKVMDVLARIHPRAEIFGY